MSDPQRRRVRVRRSPKVGVFLLIGAVVGALAAVVVGNATQDPSTPTAQAVGFFLVLLTPVGAALGGVVALVLDTVSERRARTVEAERLAPTAAPQRRQEVPADERPADRA